MRFPSPYGPLPRTRIERANDSGRTYLAWLGIILLGYAVFSRAFAYVGVPPFFVGEIILAVGLVTIWRFGAVRQALAGTPARLLAVFMVWSAANTFPYVSEHGIDALRDGAMWYYGAFAFIVAALIIGSPGHLRESLIRYRSFVYGFVAMIGAVYVASVYFSHHVPALPGSPHVPLLQAKGGDILVHLSGVTAFIVAGFMRQRLALILLLVMTIGIVVVANRGGMVAFMLAGVLLVILKPPQRSTSRLTSAFIGVLLLAMLGGSLLTIHGGRNVSVEQLWTNVKSVVGATGEKRLEGTKTWRMDWWTQIVDYTVTGPYFWTGKGYGINLATDDGFQVKEGERLRSPHNGHMTVLARSGVPGLALWLVLHGWWLALMGSRWMYARRQRDWAWVSFYAFLIPYWLAMMMNASFDVYLEGPMGGIWFWCLWGLGLGAAHVHRENPDLLRDSPAETPAAQTFQPRTIRPRRPARPAQSATPVEIVA
jgi:hypothetical protein